MNVVAEPLSSPQAPCPQCGALVTLPHRAVHFNCPWCGSGLSAEGRRVYRLGQRVRVNQQEALESVRAWMAGPDAPRDLLEQAVASITVGQLHSFPFLRLKRQGGDRVLPLAALPLPDVIELANVPADLRPASVAGDAGFEPSAHAGVAPDELLLRSRILEASEDAGTREVYLEERTYYPVAYRYRGGRFTAVVDAGAGTVLAVRRPARTKVVGEGWVAAPAALLLLAEGLLLPTLAGKLAGVALSSVTLFFFLRRLVARHG